MHIFPGNTSYVGRPELDTSFDEQQQPIDLARFLVRSLTAMGDTVLDLYGGVGTVSTAAVCEGRNAVYVDGDITMYATARSRLTKYFDTEVAKAAYLSVQKGVGATEEEAELARVYAQGVVVDHMKPTEEAVDDLMKKLDTEGPWQGMALRWGRILGRPMKDREARDLVEKWLMVQEKATFEGYRTMEEPGDAIKALNPNELENDILKSQTPAAVDEGPSASGLKPGFEASVVPGKQVTGS